MSKPRSAESMLTKLEQMKVGDEIYTFKSNGYVSDIINTVKKNFPTRKYIQQSFFTHDSPTLPASSKDFIKVIYIIRVS
jgi:hypothetical protein